MKIITDNNSFIVFKLLTSGKGLLVPLEAIEYSSEENSVLSYDKSEIANILLKHVGEANYDGCLPYAKVIDIENCKVEVIDIVDTGDDFAFVTNCSGKLTVAVPMEHFIKEEGFIGSFFVEDLSLIGVGYES